MNFVKTMQKRRSVDYGKRKEYKDAVQTANVNESSATETSEGSKLTDTEKEDIDFVVSNVRNDVTGKWRKALIAENYVCI